MPKVNHIFCQSLACLLSFFFSVQASPSWADKPIVARIAFGSCADQRQPQPIWSAVFAYQPDVFIFAGDNVYGDVSSAQMTELKEAYARANELEAWRHLRSDYRVLATWDDHDYGLNDGGGDFPYKELAKSLFLDFWNVPENDPRRFRQGVYQAEIFGSPGRRVQIILLDTRSFRSPLKPTDSNNAPGRERYLPDWTTEKTLLGEEQWQWLSQQLSQPAEVRLVVSSIQVLAQGHGWERWGNLPRERERLLKLIEMTNANGVVFLSGDRHLAGLYRETEAVPYAVYEITSSSLNRPNPNLDEAEPKRLAPLYGQENFGTIEIDWEKSNLTLAIRSLDGKVIQDVLIPLSELTSPNLSR